MVGRMCDGKARSGRTTSSLSNAARGCCDDIIAEGSKGCVATQVKREKKDNMSRGERCISITCCSQQTTTYQGAKGS